MYCEFIMYHYVRDLKNSNYPKIKGLDIKEFENQLIFLSKNYNVISIEDFYNKNFNINKKTCVLTFDDGYVDHYDFVFDKLLKYKMKGAFFPPVDVVSNDKVLDVNKIHLILASANEDLVLDRIKYHFSKLNLENTLEFYINKIDTSSRFDTKKTIIIKRLLQTVLDLKTRNLLCNKLIEEFINKSEKELSAELYLSYSQISEMIDNGMHFGSHGKSHFWFNSLNLKQQEFEIKESVKFLNSINKKEFLLTMCFPYGNYNNITLNLLKKYKFKIGLTTVSKIYSSIKDDMLLIPRFDTNDYPKN